MGPIHSAHDSTSLLHTGWDIFHRLFSPLSSPYLAAVGTEDVATRAAVVAFEEHGELLVANQPMYDLIIIPENTGEFDTTELSKLINIEEKELREKISNAINYSSKIPSLIKTQISKEENAFLQEKIWLYDGFYLRKNSQQI